MIFSRWLAANTGSRSDGDAACCGYILIRATAGEADLVFSVVVTVTRSDCDCVRTVTAQIALIFLMQEIILLWSLFFSLL